MDGAIVYICDPASPDIAWLERRGLPDGLGRPGPESERAQRQRRRPGRRPRGRPAPRRPRAHPDRHPHPSHKTFEVDGVPTANRPARERMLGWRDALDAAGIEPVVQAARLPAAALGRGRRARPARPARTGPPRSSASPTLFAVRRSRWPSRSASGSPRTCPSSASTTPAARRSPARSSPRSTRRWRAKGQEAVRALMAVMGPNRPETVERILLPTSLVVRDSTAPPPA